LWKRGDRFTQFQNFELQQKELSVHSFQFSDRKLKTLYSQRLIDSMFGRLLPLCSLLLLVGCAAVPAGNNGGQAEKPRPVKPLPWKQQAEVVPDKNQPTKGFKVADTAAPKPKATPKSSKAAASKVDNAAIAAKITEADDKASSARSMAQSAQTKDDWNLVFAQWKRAIQMLKDIPTQTAPVKQKLAEYQDGLEAATQAAKISLDPSLAPVDEVGARAKDVIGFPAEKKSPSPSPSPASPDKPQPQGKPQPSPQGKP
jgi:hypothetical protein